MTPIPGTLNPPRCEAHATGRAATDWGFAALPCNAMRGLRSFSDAQGVVRFYCPATGHRFDVERRFGLERDPDEDRQRARDLSLESVR